MNFENNIKRNCYKLCMDHNYKEDNIVRYRYLYDYERYYYKRQKYINKCIEKCIEKCIDK